MISHGQLPMSSPYTIAPQGTECQSWDARCYRQLGGTKWPLSRIFGTNPGTKNGGFFPVSGKDGAKPLIVMDCIPAIGRMPLEQPSCVAKFRWNDFKGRHELAYQM
jgi:hypothetical protein